MDKDELIAFLKEELSIQIDKTYDFSTYLRVRLLLCGEIIADDRVSFVEGSGDHY